MLFWTKSPHMVVPFTRRRVMRACKFCRSSACEGSHRVGCQAAYRHTPRGGEISVTLQRLAFSRTPQVCACRMNAVTSSWMMWRDAASSAMSCAAFRRWLRRVIVAHCCT